MEDPREGYHTGDTGGEEQSSEVEWPSMDMGSAISATTGKSDVRTRGGKALSKEVKTEKRTDPPFCQHGEGGGRKWHLHKRSTYLQQSTSHSQKKKTELTQEGEEARYCRSQKNLLTAFLCQGGGDASRGQRTPQGYIRCRHCFTRKAGERKWETPIPGEKRRGTPETLEAGRLHHRKEGVVGPSETSK